MKKLVLFLFVLLANLIKMQAQTQDSTSFIDNLNYESAKKMVLGAKLPKILSDEQLRKLAHSAEITKEDIDETELRNIVLQLYSLENIQVIKLLAMSRLLNAGREGSSKEVDLMVKDFITDVDLTYKENLFLALLDTKKEKDIMGKAKRSFSKIFDAFLEYSECLLCCEKAQFPYKKWFLLKPKKGTAIETKKADYTKWFSDRICGFYVYNFPCTVKKARINNIILWALNGTPRFNDKGVHVAMIPSVIVYGLTSLSTTPCNNSTLKSKVLNTVRIKC